MADCRRTWFNLLLLCAVVSLTWAISTVSVSRKEGIATGQVHVLQGSAGALALSYYLTGPGDLHYAIVPHGHAALAAEDIKALAGSASAVAGTFASTAATRLAWNVADLNVNTTYDVYFVAEATNSNGVFGTVVAVPGTTTHPHAPQLTLQHVAAQKASASNAEFTVNASATGGVLHYIVIPTAVSANLSAVDIWSSNHSRAVDVPSRDALHVNVTELTPFTTYDLWLVTEVKGSDGVLGDVVHAAAAFTTHAIAPDAVHVACIPRSGTTSQLLVGLRLEFPPRAFDGLHAEVLQARPLEYVLHYAADADVDNDWLVARPTATSIQNASNSSSLRQTGQLHLSFPVHASNTVTVVSATDTLVDLHANLTGLIAGGNYTVAIVVESKGSHGLFGAVASVAACRTHPTAPLITAIQVEATPTTTDAAVLTVTTADVATLHYVLGTPAAFRNVPLELQTSPAAFVDDAGSFRAGVLPVGANASTTLNVSLAELAPSTVYAVTVFAETIDSGGVFGPPSPRTEFRTNDLASRVVSVVATPVVGSTTEVAVNITLDQTNPSLRHHVSLCWRDITESSDEFACLNHTDHVVVAVNFTPAQAIDLYVVAETVDGHVTSARSDMVHVTTHASPPDAIDVTLARVPGRLDQLAATIESATPCWVHVTLVDNRTNTTTDALRQLPLDKRLHHRVQLMPPNGSLALVIDGLAANTTYTLAVFSESLGVASVNGSGVFGSAHATHATTFAHAPTIVQSSVRPLNATVDAIQLLVNVSTPGRVHYMITDTDVHDPAVLQRPVDQTDARPFVRRGSFDIVDQVWTTVNETRGGVNVTVDVALPLFHGNLSVDALTADTRYHVFILTETTASDGVFGSLVAPHLVTTHAHAPRFDALVVRATPGHATSISFNFTLSRHGLVHYVLLDRGIAADAAPYYLHANATDDLAAAVVSSLDSVSLTPAVIQRASLADFGPGTLSNGSISVLRDDLTKVGGHRGFKAFTDHVKTGATYELCVVAETDASDGVFGDVACHIVTTHMDYSNATRAGDDVDAAAVDGTTDQVALTWRVASGARIQPYFVLVQSNHLSPFSVLGFARTPFSAIRPGQNGAVAGGAMAALPAAVDNDLTIDDANATTTTTVVVYHTVVRELEPGTSYAVYFAGETIGSDGLFTDVNGSLLVATHVPPPLVTGYAARATTGNTTGLDVLLDLACPKAHACSHAIVHVAVVDPACVAASAAAWFPLGSERCPVVYFSDVRNVSIGGGGSVKQHVLFLDGVDRLAPATTYAIVVATESHGVFGPTKTIPAVTTHPPPPTFVELDVRPKNASTTELVLRFALSAPGVVHYVIAEDLKHVDVTSAYNISARKFGGTEDWHKYPPQTIVYRRSVTIETTTPVDEVLAYLTANTSYTVWVVAETEADAQLYGSIHTFANVSTHAPAPRLLAHAAAPTPGVTTHLRVDYKLNDVHGVVHVVVATAAPHWPHAAHLTALYGNRIGLETTIVAQRTLRGGGDGTVVDIPVPHADTAYSVVLVTETADSHGVFGVVAQLDAIKSSAPAPDVTDARATASDARTDALTIDVALSRPGLVHYVVVVSPHVPDAAAAAVVEANTTAIQFQVEGLEPSTLYDVYIQTETLGSGGVVGPLIKLQPAARTHGPPPVVLEDVDCSDAPPCDALGREPCWFVSHTCGECREGFVGDDGPANTACVVGDKKRKGRKSIGIKISGVTQPSAAADTGPTTPQPPIEMHVPAAADAPADVVVCPDHAAFSLTTNRCECTDGYAAENGVCVLLCPPNSSPASPGRCQCDAGFALDALQTACVRQGSPIFGGAGVHAMS
ncbi:Aste57867_11830 [Aphanomyces stellatus]|uniref:Aste57867_11830 protein n=1 Tax=Aphanomyces stellatus TaxID=120398 RepID=A0A485KUG2_9STRA|nr:hypothetical protein As57867_011785 [Aphanomyces stellatus]VFT88685.1 Aste57867_11830 [Aphanomyces stellatus]